MAFKARMTGPSHLSTLLLPFLPSFHFGLYLCVLYFLFLEFAMLLLSWPSLCMCFPGSFLSWPTLIHPPGFSSDIASSIKPSLAFPGWTREVLLCVPTALCTCFPGARFSGCGVIAPWFSCILYAYHLTFNSNVSPLLQRKLKQICGTCTVPSKASNLPHLLASCSPSHLLGLRLVPPLCTGPHASPAFRGLLH